MTRDLLVGSMFSCGCVAVVARFASSCCSGAAEVTLAQTADRKKRNGTTTFTDDPQDICWMMRDATMIRPFYRKATVRVGKNVPEEVLVLLWAGLGIPKRRETMDS